jgi:branched-chain amino acid transport system substrate-binding protein
MRSWIVTALVLPACAIEFEPKRCSVDDDCGGGAACELRDEQPVCVHVEDAPIVLGQTAPSTGLHQSLGTQMRLGIELALAEQNEAGGIRGRRLELRFRDDAYTPHLAEAAARALIDARAKPGHEPRCPSTAMPAPGQSPVSTTALERGPGAVLALIGSIGTSTMLRAAPIAVETETLYFGPASGARTLLRDDGAGPCARYVFNVRASYREEARASLGLFARHGITDHRDLISFDQNDAFGQAGYDALLDAYLDTHGPFSGGGSNAAQPIARFRYTRSDDGSVPAQAIAVQGHLAQLLADRVGTVRVGIVMAASDGAAAELVRALRTWQYANDAQQQTLDKATRLELRFSALAFGGADALAARLVAAGTVATPNGPRSLTEGVAVSHVVPNHHDDASELVASYHRLVAARGESPSFTSLEGYAVARVFLAGLLAHRGPFAVQPLVSTFERLPELGLGLGATAGFSATDHQYTRSVWGTSIRPDGTFANLYFWTEGIPIQFFE